MSPGYAMSPGCRSQNGTAIDWTTVAKHGTPRNLSMKLGDARKAQQLLEEWSMMSLSSECLARVTL